MSAERFGMAVVAINRGIHTVGDARERVSVQRISKLFACTLAFQLLGSIS
ncbi:glutaminase family protein [Burkholderia thailandensis USAMRU Malaysia |uniref:glutaminase n=1 Tax=Burkholderia thailandensis (strain ATCC 700388 / DSM 13276 / CCUG 48851 / CIP 106301 / E264) TaxID=271848 RepID=Q2T4C1_BURTA|nr:glutaminase A [Burkholderia thailandensis E264]AHI77232.1 glutaminase family protein [Burkholderia thailandensis 2002721723]AHI80736.1 glutaminase family protein [Burkholderia thailandensis E444]AIC91167.1 glutaminase family protein [Burkholderia thailandensis USAMRU Malaysia \